MQTFFCHTYFSHSMQIQKKKMNEWIIIENNFDFLLILAKLDQNGWFRYFISGFLDSCIKSVSLN